MIAATYRPGNLGTLAAPTTRRHRCRPFGSETFAIAATPTVIATSPSSVTEFDDKDQRKRTINASSTRTDYAIQVLRTAPPGVASKSVTLESTNTSVLTSPASGVATGVSSGTTTIVARAADGEVSTKTLPVTVTGATTSTTVIGKVAGSLSAHCDSQIESRVAGKNRSSMDIWSVRNHDTQQYVWNPDCWGADITNLNCISVWNSTYINAACGTLISPRHILCCHHLWFYPQVGATVRFVRPDGVAENFTVTAVEAHPLSAGWIVAVHDIVVCKLDRDVPASIKFAKVLPPNPNPKLPSVYTGGTGVSQDRVRSCFTNQFKRLATGWLERLPNTPPGADLVGSGVGQYYAHVRHMAGEWNAETQSQYPILAFWPVNPLGDNIILGDSGSPAFLVVNNELVLTNVWSGIGTGYALYADASVVNGMMATLGGGYQLTQADLSGFPTY